MSKLLVIFGISGQQGASVAKRVLSTSALSTVFKLRGVTRDPASSLSKVWLDSGVELVKADLDDASSLKTALAGAHTVYGMTNSPFDNSKKHIEVEQGKRLADAAVAAGAKHLIWSTTPSAITVSAGVLKQVGHFDAKADVEAYIRTLPIAKTFYSPGAFMQNFTSYFRAIPMGSGSFSMMQFVSPETKLPLIDITNDTGKFIEAILQRPEDYEDRVVAAAAGVYSFQEVADIMSKLSGKDIGYMQIPEEGWKSNIPEFMREEMTEMMKLFQDYGYYGTKTEALVQEGQRGVEDITSMEKFVKENLAGLGLA